MTQIITQDCCFSPDFVSYIAQLEHTNFEYHTCSIIGEQGSGKSTLLNDLMGEQIFETQGRKIMQTTKGIFAAINKRVLFLDNEGTNAGNRGGEEEVEIKYALFSLITEVILVNINAQDLDKLTPRKLAKQIFVAFTRLANRQCEIKRKLLFIIRDADDKDLQDSIVKFNDDIIYEYQKCMNADDQLSQVIPIDQMFDIEFLPFDRRQGSLSGKYLENIESLRSRLFEINCSSYLFNQAYGNLQIKSLPEFYSSVWTDVNTLISLDMQSKMIPLIEGYSRAAYNKSFKSFLQNFESIGNIENISLCDLNSMILQAMEIFDEEVTAEHFKLIDIDQVREGLLKQMVSEARLTAYQIVELALKNAIKFWECEKNKGRFMELCGGYSDYFRDIQENAAMQLKTLTKERRQRIFSNIQTGVLTVLSVGTLGGGLIRLAPKLIVSGVIGGVTALLSKIKK